MRRRQYVFKRERRTIEVNVQPTPEGFNIKPVCEEKKQEPVRIEPVKETKKESEAPARPATSQAKAHTAKQAGKPEKEKTEPATQKKNRKPVKIIQRSPRTPPPQSVKPPAIVSDEFARLSKAYENVELTNLEKIINHFGKR